jgi:hypothetical protein
MGTLAAALACHCKPLEDLRVLDPAKHALLSTLQACNEHQAHA